MDNKVKKMELFYQILTKWVHILQMGGSLGRYFVENDYKRVAIYGMAELGGLLYDELHNQNIEVAYVIDKRPNRIYAERIISPEDDFIDVDVIVVTAVYCFDEILASIQNKTESRIISLYEVVNDSEIYYSLDNNIKKEYL